MVPNQLGSPRQIVHRIFRLSRGTGCGHPEIQGPNSLGTICPRGTNFLGPFVHGDQICWGLFVQGDQFHGDCLSKGKGSQGVEVRGSNRFGTKCVAAGKTNDANLANNGQTIAIILEYNYIRINIKDKQERCYNNFSSEDKRKWHRYR